MSEHDNDTCPHLVLASLLEAENARLKADAQLVVKHLGEACADNLRLKADVVELADALKLASEVGIKVADEVTRLKAEVERLEHQVKYWRIEAETDNARWLRSLEENERLRSSSFVTAVPVEQYERLIKAGDAMAEELIGRYFGNRLVTDWNAAKEGKQP